MSLKTANKQSVKKLQCNAKSCPSSTYAHVQISHFPTLIFLNVNFFFLKKRKLNSNNLKVYSTFFFCFPPPDLAGFDDGGGAFSFFGAYKKREISDQ